MGEMKAPGQMPVRVSFAECRIADYSRPMVRLSDLAR